MPAHEREMDGHQVDHAEQAEAGDEGQRAAGGEVAAGEHAEVHERLATAQGERGEGREQHGAEGEAARGIEAQPALLGRSLQAELERGKTGGQEHQRRPIDAASERQVRRIPRQQRKAGRGRQQTGREIDVEQPAPP